jgi:hypothetical protein
MRLHCSMIPVILVDLFLLHQRLSWAAPQSFPPIGRNGFLHETGRRDLRGFRLLESFDSFAVGRRLLKWSSY